MSTKLTEQQRDMSSYGCPRLRQLLRAAGFGPKGEDRD